MAVPKKRRSKQSTRRHKTVWFEKAYQTGAKAFASGIQIQRKKSVQSFEGFGKKPTG